MSIFKITYSQEVDEVLEIRNFKILLCFFFIQFEKMDTNSCFIRSLYVL